MDWESNENSDMDENENQSGTENFDMGKNGDQSGSEDSELSNDEDDYKTTASKKSSKSTCVNCKKKKKIHCRSMCITCYRKDLKDNRKPANLIKCAKCNQMKKHEARGLCNPCYKSVKRAGQLDQYAKTRGKSNNSKKDTCTSCQKLEIIYTRLMCRPCYEADLKSRHKAGEKTCPTCKKLKQLEKNGFCSQCNLNDKIEEEALIKLEPIEIDHELEALLKDIEECSSIQSANLVISLNSVGNAMQFEHFSKIKIEFVEQPTLKKQAEPILIDLTMDDTEDDESSTVHKYAKTEKKPSLMKTLNFDDSTPLNYDAFVWKEKHSGLMIIDLTSDAEEDESTHEYSMPSKEFVSKVKQHIRMKLIPRSKKSLVSQSDSVQQFKASPMTNV